MFAVTAHEVGGGGGEVRVDGITLDAIAAWTTRRTIASAKL